MPSRTNRFLLAALSVAIGVLLVVAGFLLGMDPDIGGALRDYVQGGGSSSLSAEDYDLQREVLAKLEASYYKEIDPEIVRVGAIDGMLAALADPWTVYMDPEEYAAFMETTSGSYSGVGMTLQMKSRLVTVIGLFDGTPAAEAGLKEGDILISVDGLSTEGQTLDEVVSGIKGPEGTDVVLEVYRPPVPTTTSTTEFPTSDVTLPRAELSGLPPGGATTVYTITRKEIEIPTTERETVYADGREVALISLFTFSEAAAGDLRAEVEQAVEQDGVSAVILDLRGNGGGLLNSAVDVAGIFIESGVITSTEGLHSPEQVYTADGEAYADIPLYVLTDEDTASASEIVAGALQDYDRATLVGTTTFSKGLVQSIERLSDGGALKLTTAVYLTPDGRDINETGIEPDVVAPDDPTTEDVDECVEAVLDLITSGSAAQ
ncbi:MAG: S41 family peptidase [Thermoleophilia bacterium]|nr:S41 family peptidase [Thermoleophilia bacterium]